MVTGELHAIAGVAGEADDDLVECDLLLGHHNPFDDPILPCRFTPDEPRPYAERMRVQIRQVALACCALEVSTALVGPFPALEGVEWVDAQPDLTVLVLAGTITHASKPKIEAALSDIDGPRVVAAYGVCASSGGPYWDAYSVQQGWAADVFVPGCPPRPDALWGAVREALQVSHVG